MYTTSMYVRWDLLILFLDTLAYAQRPGTMFCMYGGTCTGLVTRAKGCNE